MIRDRHRSALATTLLVATLLTVVGVPLVTGTAAAQVSNNTSIPDYYNYTPTVENESWMNNDSNASAHRVALLATRVGTFIIGGGTTGAAGAVLTALLVFGVVVSMVGGTAPGIITGTVLGVLTIAALAATGFAAPWLWAIVVFGVGAVAAAALIRLIE